MKIKLIRTGGFIPVTKMAEADVSLSAQELSRLIDVIKPDPSAARLKDATYYQLSVGTSSHTIDLEKVPAEYADLFGKLKKELKIVK